MLTAPLIATCLLAPHGIGLPSRPPLLLRVRHYSAAFGFPPLSPTSSSGIGKLHGEMSVSRQSRVAMSAALTMAPLKPRASPAALRALRDMAVVEEKLTAMKAAVRPSAECSQPPTAALTAMAAEVRQG